MLNFLHFYQNDYFCSFFFLFNLNVDLFYNYKYLLFFPFCYITVGKYFLIQYFYLNIYNFTSVCDLLYVSAPMFFSFYWLKTFYPSSPASPILPNLRNILHSVGDILADIFLWTASLQFCRTDSRSSPKTFSFNYFFAWAAQLDKVCVYIYIYA